MPHHSTHLLNELVPPALHTSLPLRPENLNRIATAIGDKHPECLPHLRWLLLGPYANSKLFPSGFSTAPSVEEIDQLLATLEQAGLASIARTISQLANGRRGRVATNLDHFESLPPESWSHPAQEIRRPWQLEQLLELCQRRIETTNNSERETLLTSIAEKLQQALDLEEKAAKRRREDQEKFRKARQALKKPRKKRRR